LEIDGTEDVKEFEDEDGNDVEITTDPSRTTAVAEELKACLPEVHIVSSVIAWVPNEDTLVGITEGSREEENLTKLIGTFTYSQISEISLMKGGYKISWKLRMV
jgi:hypothetical protein